MEKLEGTSSRLEMTRILAELYEKVKPEEGKIVAYLTAGRLGPAYDNPNFGVADKMMVRALGPEAEKLFKKLGDLGKVAEQLKSQKVKGKITSEKLEVKQMFEKLIDVANTSGEGSQDKKQQLIRELIEELGSLEARYATKMILGKLRTGFSDMTVLDSLSWMVTGDKTLRPMIEKIYNVRADLGEVVRLVKEHGSREKLEKLKIDPVWGVPILVARAERAKTIGEIWTRNGESAAEHKMDGIRIQAHIRKHQILNSKSQINSNNKNLNKKNEILLFSRGLENVTEMYPDVVEGLRQQVHQECILDGEIIAVDKNGKYLPFQETAQRKRKYDILAAMSKIPLKYYVFDVLMLEGKSLLDLSNKQRWEELKKTVTINSKSNRILLIPRKIVKSEKEIEEFFKEALEEGTEGVMVKRLDGVYKSGSRDFNWIKYKKSYDEKGMADTIDAVVMGYDVGEGKRSGFGIGGFLIGVYDRKNEKYKTIAKIGTGLKDEEWRALKTKCEMHRSKNKPENYEVGKLMNCDFWIKPKLVVEIKADEISKSPMHTAGYALRFPRLVSFREMKVEEAVTPQEIERLFKLQRGK